MPAPAENPDESGSRSWGTRLYRRLMGVDARVLTGSPAAARIRTRTVIYYAYRKGFWSLVRGTIHRVRLGACAGRFFLGRRTQILFPGQLRVGHNVAIGDYVSMMCLGQDGVRLGDNVRIREFGWVQVTSHLTNPGVGVTVSEGTYIGPHCVLGGAGGIAIGQGVMLGAYVQLLSEEHLHSADAPVARQGVTRSGITIEDGCWLGNGVIVLDGVTIGANSVIGAGAVVVGDIPPSSVAVGSPARVVTEPSES
jgi:acetyltransferase-like isoleucine patch superfamily enzyme